MGREGAGEVYVDARDEDAEELCKSPDAFRPAVQQGGDGVPKAPEGGLVVVYNDHGASRGRKWEEKGREGERNGRSGCWLAVLGVMWVGRPSAGLMEGGG